LKDSATTIFKYKIQNEIFLRKATHARKKNKLTVKFTKNMLAGKESKQLQTIRLDRKIKKVLNEQYLYIKMSSFNPNTP